MGNNNPETVDRLPLKELMADTLKKTKEVLVAMQGDELISYLDYGVLAQIVANNISGQAYAEDAEINEVLHKNDDALVKYLQQRLAYVQGPLYMEDQLDYEKMRHDIRSQEYNDHVDDMKSIGRPSIMKQPEFSEATLRAKIGAQINDETYSLEKKISYLAKLSNIPTH